jgi:hypothetical protein
MHQVLDAGKILRHRVDHHQVVGSRRHPAEVVGRTLQQHHLLQVALLHLLAQRGQRGGRQVGAAVVAARGRQAQEQQPAATADLQHPPRLQRAETRQRGIDPLAHLAGGDRLPSVAADPTAEVEAGIGRLLAIDRLPDRLPLREVRGRRVGLQRWELRARLSDE